MVRAGTRWRRIKYNENGVTIFGARVGITRRVCGTAGDKSCLARTMIGVGAILCVICIFAAHLPLHRRTAPAPCRSCLSRLVTINVFPTLRGIDDLPLPPPFPHRHRLGRHAGVFLSACCLARSLRLQLKYFHHRGISSSHIVLPSNNRRLRQYFPRTAHLRCAASLWHHIVLRVACRFVIFQP